MRSISRKGAVSMAGVLFLFSVAMILGSVAAAVWLCTTRQVFSFDGLFLFLSSLVVLLSFSPYVRFLMRSALSEPKESTSRSTEAAAARTTVLQAGIGQARDKNRA
jgi:hypothetical protein